MNEDLDFNRFLKESLESAESIHFYADSVRRHSSYRWVMPTLLAASFGLAAILHATFSDHFDSVSDAIELLSVADGLEVYGETPSDMLLAWQDVPCNVAL